MHKALRDAMNAAGTYGDAGTAAHHIVARNAGGAAGARNILSRNGIGLDTLWNGVFLPSKRFASKARGVIHEGLDSSGYYQRVTERLAEAESLRGRAGVLRELQKIRSELVNGFLQ